MKRNVSELFLDEIYSPLRQVTNLNVGEIFENLLDNNDNVVPGPELGDVGVTVKRTLKVNDVLQDLCKHLKFN